MSYLWYPEAVRWGEVANGHERTQTKSITIENKDYLNEGGGEREKANGHVPPATVVSVVAR